MLRPIVAGAGALAVALPIALAGSGVSAKEVKFCFKTGNGKNYLAVDRRSGFLHARAKSCAGDAVFAVAYPTSNPNSAPRMSAPMVIRAANDRYVMYYGLRMRAVGTAAQVKDAKQRARMMMLPRASHNIIRGGTPLAAGMQIGIYPTITRSRIMLTALGGGGRDIRNARRGNPKARQNFFTLTDASGAAPVAAKPRPLPWKGVPGKALDVGVGGGQAWVVGTDGAAWRWNGKAFEKRGGSEILRIDVGPRGLPWVVTKQRDILRFDGRGFRKLPGKAMDVGVSGDGGAWVVGTDGAAYQWTGKSWAKRGGKGLTRIDATLKGGAVATDHAGNIHRFAGGKWGRLPGKARDISGGGGQLWSVGMDRSPGGMTVNRWDGKGKWVLYQGGIRQRGRRWQGHALGHQRQAKHLRPCQVGGAVAETACGAGRRRFAKDRGPEEARRLHEGQHDQASAGHAADQATSGCAEQEARRHGPAVQEDGSGHEAGRGRAEEGDG